MSTVAVDVACPSWCEDHPLTASDGSSGVVHRGSVSVGRTVVEVEWAPDAPEREGSTSQPCVVLPALEWINGPDLRELIAALSSAADLLEGVPAPGWVGSLARLAARARPQEAPPLPAPGPRELRRMNDIASRHLPRGRHERERVGYALIDRIRAGEASRDELQAFIDGAREVFTIADLQTVAEQALRDGVAPGKARALCGVCGRRRTVGALERFTAVGTVMLACRTCRVRTSHSCLPDNDPFAPMRQRGRDEAAQAAASIEKTSAELQAAGVPVRVLDTAQQRVPTLWRATADGSLWVELRTGDASPYYASVLRAIFIALALGPDSPLFEWCDAGDGQEFAILTR